MLVLAIILIIIIIIAFLPFRVSINYSEMGIRLIANVGIIRFTLLPRPQKEKKPKAPKKQKEKAAKAEEAEITKKGGKIEYVKGLLPIILDTLDRFRRKLTVDTLTVQYTSAPEDPFDAAMNFGSVSAAFGLITPVLENHFKIKKRDFRTAVSFDGDGSRVYIDARLTLRFWEIIYIACGLLPVLGLPGKEKSQPEGGKVDNNGQASGK